MKENSFTIDPEVNSAQEFIEISPNFSNSLDLVREAISNAFDAQAKNIVMYNIKCRNLLREVFIVISRQKLITISNIIR